MDNNNNNPVYSVGEFSHVIKKLVETNFSYVRIRGEISRPSFPGSGHVYFTLKDADGTIAAIIWKYSMPRLSIRPEEVWRSFVRVRLQLSQGNQNIKLL